MATHSSAMLNFVLVDFKGGATFLGMEQAPHVAAVITNLADDLTQVTRMQDALAGEMNRRQELLRTAGNFANVKDYEKARDNGADLDPLPALFIVIDEFSELLAQKPEFIDLFVAIGRLGRSLQMHLLLASQRLEEGRLRGLESHLSYRIGLKTFSAGESRAVLGVPDAYELPPLPGSGYLKFDTMSMERFKAAYVSGPYRAGGIATMASTVAATSDRQPRLFVPDYVDLPEAAELSDHQPVFEVPPENLAESSVLDVVVARLGGQGPRPTRCGCRRWTSRHRWTSCCRRCRLPEIAGCPRSGSSVMGGWLSRSESWTNPTNSAVTCSGRISPGPLAMLWSPAARSRASPPCCAAC